MFEFHGWATIKASPGCDDPPTPVAEVRQVVEGENRSNHTVDLRVANGDLQLWVAGFHNHRDGSVLELFKRVAAVAPGSYGILYVHDDEVADVERQNTWTRFVMKRGEVHAEVDESLSPHIGVVEDDCFGS